MLKKFQEVFKGEAGGFEYSMEQAFFERTVERDRDLTKRKRPAHVVMRALDPRELKTSAFKRPDALFAGDVREFGHTASLSTSDSTSHGTGSPSCSSAAI